jgi:hypothetical protein
MRNTCLRARSMAVTFEGKAAARPDIRARYSGRTDKSSSHHTLLVPEDDLTWAARAHNDGRTIRGIVDFVFPSTPWIRKLAPPPG